MDHMAHIKQKINNLSYNTHSTQQYRKKVLNYLRRAVSFDAACFTTVDPETLLSAGSVTVGDIEQIHQRLFEHEYVVENEDFNSFQALAAKQVPVETLSHATDGVMEQSARYRETLKPAGYIDELRAVMRVEGRVWGFLILFRKHTNSCFSETERLFVSSLISSIAGHMRELSSTIPSESTESKGEGTGLLVLTENLQMISYNQAATAYLSRLQAWEEVRKEILPRPIRAVCNMALTKRGAARDEDEMAKVCIHIPDGPFMTIRASKQMTVEQEVQLVVIMEPATASELLPLIADSYRLTDREKEILMLLVKGNSTVELAKSLHISAYTVQDHLKSIFMKTGVKSRRELIWKVHSRFSVQ
ncbi:helix-turn-helix transcriptional regulator [Paenibacillus sp. 1001270B_150601_E10]|uniref:helix-turn-helix transcriptional regulator n=1 Tax=Paenibacillus sp. 1001270B_150601_E10 TaxID=2787079 RepID=UPI00189E37A4|nr:helix-turn-helix transcriptional regulator [Paenibacillus sp. 1001270B_150601_E10]